ncbi:MAG: DNA-processing protein DprA [Clostridia bacterium]|nr:DNA-processing protein DprA [Clostridia bacterium]
MNLSTMEQYWIWLGSVEGIGPKRFYQLISYYEDARAVWDNVGDEGMKFLGPAVLKKLKEARDERYFFELFRRLEKSGMRVVTRLSDDYPPLLADIFDPPSSLYVIGDADIRDERSFSIVGSRRCTRDGQRAAREFAETLAREDVAIISGMAHGIDTAAHEGALIGMGRTIAVLGCGADVIYPPENEALYRRIIDNGGAVISEYAPGTQPKPGNFPARNRIISGMGQGTLIVEGAEKSGAMITVRSATEQNRDVFAVPGSIYSPLSAAPNRLIVEGAIPAISGWDILEHYRWAARPNADEAAPKARIELDPEDDQIVKPLLEQELSFDELANLVDFPIAKLNSHLTMLELRGIIVKVPGGLYRAYL